MNRPSASLKLLGVTAVGLLTVGLVVQARLGATPTARGLIYANAAATSSSSSSSSSCPSGNNLCLGPQAMEGNLVVSPGDILKAGFDFKIPGQHPATNDYFTAAQVSFQATCVGKGGGGTVLVPTPETPAGYTDPANDASDWFPSKDQASPLVYQGSLAVPNLCGGTKISLSAGGIFTALVESFDTTDALSVRWHYSADGSAGGWSATANVVPAHPTGSFSVSGDLRQLIDGATDAVLPLTIHNPNPFSIQVLTVNAPITVVPTGCKAGWLTVTNFSSPPSAPITIGPSSDSTALNLPVKFVDSKTQDDQGSCIGKGYTLTYNGTGVVSGP